VSPAPAAAHNLIVLELPSRLELLGVVDKVADGVTELLAFEDVDKDAVAISVVEACTNAIQHGHHEDAEKLVRVTFELNRDEIRICVTDRGEGFVPPAEEETSPPDLLATRGRGIFIMRAMMDTVDFQTDGGTTVCLLKRRSIGRSEEDPPAP
jgi:serine/threonine-protein kinase RsbW